MVKRKWLWGKKSGGESESLGSMSSQSEKFSEDQTEDTSKGSPAVTTSPEVTSSTTNSDINGEESYMVPDGPSDDVSKDRLAEEKLYNDLLDKYRPDALLDDRSKDSSSKDDVLEQTVNEESRPEIPNSEAKNGCEDDESVKLLTEKLSAALLNVSLKDDLVKQHAKVAEEAVAGWEKAENEAANIKQKLEAVVQQKSALDSRVTHLDEALKECVRQLRLSRDEQERKINQAVVEKTSEIELAKTKLEDQLLELQAQVETSRVKSPDPELLHKLEILERDNMILRQELHLHSEELEVRTIERDLSTRAAETASKQHLESIKKLAKLEAECRKLRSLYRFSPSINDNKMSNATSYVDSLTDSQSDGAEQLSATESDCRKMNGFGSHECEPGRSESWASALIAELDQFKSEKVADRNTVEIDLMDDFLEMERLAALPDSRPQGQLSEKQLDENETKLRNELTTVIHRLTELEEVIERAEAEKAELTMTLAQTQGCLEESQVQLIETQMKLEQMERELLGQNEVERQDDGSTKSFDTELNLMASKIETLERDIESKQTLLNEKTARCDELANELEKKTKEQDIQQDATSVAEMVMELQAKLQEAEVKIRELERELEEADEEKKSLQSQLETVRIELDMDLLDVKKENVTLRSELDTVSMELQTKTTEFYSLVEQLHVEQSSAAEFSKKSMDLENELSLKREAFEELQRELQEANEEISSLNSELASLRMELQTLSTQVESLKEQVHKEHATAAELSSRCTERESELSEKKDELVVCIKELEMANDEKVSLNSELDIMRSELKTMSNQIESLNEQVSQERALAAEFSAKYEELENELLRKRRELNVQQAHANSEPKIKQEDLEVAEGKLADCQKTIASLGSQLKSLATLEDFLIDTAGIPGFSPPAPLMARHTSEPWRLHSNRSYRLEKDFEPSTSSQDGFSLYTTHNASRQSPVSATSSPSSSPYVSHRGSDSSANGFAKYLSLTRN